MAVPDAPVISGAVEGILDEAVLCRLIDFVGGRPGPMHGRNGKAAVLRNLRGYNAAAKFSPWAVLLDLNGDADCAPVAKLDWLPDPAPAMCFRIAVREIEAWLFADPERLAKSLSLPIARIPRDPENILKPKERMVDIARSSRKRAVREDMVPHPGSGRAVGRAYTSRMTDFVLDYKTGWRPEAAANSCESLARCLACLRGLCEP